MDDSAPTMHFVPCVKWIRKGVAKSNPEKVQLTPEELEAIISGTRNDLNDDDEEVENQMYCISKVNEDGHESRSDEDGDGEAISDNDKYDFAHYDDDKPDAVLGIGNIAVYASDAKDPYITLPDDDDSDKEDDTITPWDNLIVVGHVQGDASILEIYVYNENDGSLYIHHDILLPSFPLCLEWLSYDSADEAPGNLCAVGSMSSLIEIWDLDMVDCLEPVFKLGRKANKKAGNKRYGHKDAVLDLSWNSNLPHILASGSVDQTVLLWDLDNCQYATKMSQFSEKVQALEWHPYEGQTLLTGSSDCQVRLFDCRTEDTFKIWQMDGEVEKVLWNHFNPFYFLVGTDTGTIHYVDCRNENAVWKLGAHNKEITGLSISPVCPGFLVTSSTDGHLKTWDIAGDPPVFVSERNLGIGAVHCLGACPDSAYIICAGGSKRSNSFQVCNLAETDGAVQRKFSTRKLVQTQILEQPVNTSDEMKNLDTQVNAEPMDVTTDTTEALATLSLEHIPKKTYKNIESSGKKKKLHRSKKYRK